MNPRALAAGLLLFALVPLAAPGCEPARAQDADGEEPEAEVPVNHLLRALVRETRGVQDAIRSSSSGSSDLGADLKAIREALKPGEIAVVALPAEGSAGAHETALAGYAGRGYRLVAVSEGFAYLQRDGR